MVWSSKHFLFLFIALICFYRFSFVETVQAQPKPNQKPNSAKNLNIEDTPFPSSKPTSSFTSIQHSVEQDDSSSSKQSLFSSFLDFNSKGKDASFGKVIDRYRKIFDYQTSGNFKKADQEILKLKNTSLMGHVLLHRYTHPSGYDVTFEELKEWLRRYNDHPSANRIYELAKRSQATDEWQEIKKPYYTTYMNGSLETSLHQPKHFKPIAPSRSSKQNDAVITLKQKVRDHIKNGFPTGALNTLRPSPAYTFMSQQEKDLLVSYIARSYLIEGKPEDAFQLASIVADRYKHEIPLSGWVAGIAAWQQKRYTQAALYFEKTASSSYANEWMLSAAGYWAARAYEKKNNKDRTNYWLRETALFPRTFYGLLANKKLNVTEDFNWNAPEFNTDTLETLISDPRGERAYYLANLGLEELATMELEGIDPKRNSSLTNSILSVAIQYNLSRFLFKFGNSVQDPNGNVYDRALYPQLDIWNEMDKHIIDKALVHAFIRQESRFKPNAYSLGGAIGLMQILPSTAAYISGHDEFKTTEKNKLRDPKTNIQVGQKYIASLLKHPHVKNDLFSLLIAYNAGPGTLKRWKDRIQIVDDPLLFIELIPSAETRAFVEHVMANFWIYRDQFGQESPSIEALIHNVWPPYRGLDG